MADDVSASSGTRVFIGPEVSLSTFAGMDEAAAVANFEAIIEGDWTEINPVESLGEFGDQASQITFVSLKDGRVRKLKGPKDAGTLAIVCGYNGEDEGQLAAKAAEGSPSNFRFRVILNDEPTSEYSPSSFYFAGQVMSRAVNVADANAATKRTFNVGISTPVWEDPADPTGS